ncbi:Phosphorylated carbohydrates phosphatase [Methylacidimicrobium sp. AP8]|uniref:HAD family hydrolase n=1 Tax=Methylacidimicrobium sp. AP8 TaxID=2730359 RepID=UPI0018C1AD82|nr:HAD family hydrolase [Methylacidimicrobium sp. AP8]CAB4244143.1 Phosphorylated carbohydrates phosphatase [Methylacidimicrobium sp. AP8]
MRWDGLIWDLDGTIALTEREGHLPACNAAFAALGLPISWSWKEFQSLLAIPGNELRMRRALEALRPPPSGLEETAKKLGKLKREIYLERFLPYTRLRPGVRRWIQDAQARGIRQAIVSTSDEEQIRALLALHLPEEAGWFSPILGKESGRKTAADAPLHRRCLAEWGFRPERVLAIEDSAVGLRAARAAGMPCVIIYNDYTADQDFTGALWRGASFADYSLERLDREMPAA